MSKFPMYLAFASFVLAGNVAASVRTVALSNNPAPGTSVGVHFNLFTPPVLNSAGEVAFHANLIGGGANFPNNQGIWSEGSGSLQLVARTGDVAPGTTGGATFASFSGTSFVMNTAGQTAFIGEVTGGDTTFENRRGVWIETAGALGMAVRSGDVAPGTMDGARFDVFIYGDRLQRAPLLNSFGEIAIRTDVTGAGVVPANDGGIWAGGAGDLQLVAREGDAAGALAGMTFGGIGLPVINSAGQVAFRALHTDVSVGESNTEGVWLAHPSGAMTLIARSLGQPFGLPTTVRYRFLGQPVINANGSIAFEASLAGFPVSSSNDEGIWLMNTSASRLVIRKGSGAGLPAGVNFGELVAPVINSADQTAFRALLAGGSVTALNNESLWSEGSGSLALIAREGERAPATPAGVLFGRGLDGSLAALEEPVLNAAGQLAFLGYLNGSGVFGSNDRGIWAQDAAGVLKLIAREGDTLEVGPGDIRTVQSLEFVGGSGNEDGRGSGFNDAGQVAFYATFVGGTRGVFVSNLVATVPEPAAWFLLASTALTAMFMRRVLRYGDPR